MFLTAPIPSELLNLFAMNERAERREREMGFKIRLERRREYKLAFSFFFLRVLENVLEQFFNFLQLRPLTSRYKLNNFTMIKPLCGLRKDGLKKV